MCEGGPFGSLGLWDSGGLDCSVGDKPKPRGEILGSFGTSRVQNSGILGMLERMLPKVMKARAMWPHLGILGVQGSGGHVCRKEKGHLVSNDEFSSSRCVR
jgi:hypothetical protein